MYICINAYMYTYISWKIGSHFVVHWVLGLHFELWLWFVINGNPLKLRLQKKTETDFQDKNPSTYYIFMPDKSGVKIKASKFFL